MMQGFQLAQVNIGRARAETTDPVMAGFMSRLDEINALAERSRGFVWRLQTEDGDATAVRPYADNRIMGARVDPVRVHLRRGLRARPAPPACQGRDPGRCVSRPLTHFEDGG